MKIALIGEFSGVHAGLKKGLEELGHHVDIYSDGDGFKKIPSNRTLNSNSNTYISKACFYLYGLPKTLTYIAKHYDVIQLVNPHVLRIPRESSLYYYRLMKIFNKTKAIKSLAVVGCETNVQPNLAALSRSPCPGCLRDLNLFECPYTKKGKSKITQLAENFSNHLIPLGGPSYAKSYQHSYKYREILPFAVDTSTIPYRKNLINGRIKIIHGITRAGFKGSDIILDALKKVECDYPDFFEIIIIERLPFSEYMKLLCNANVVIDQIYGDGLGMNALYSMASSCVVLTSFERVSVGGLNLKDAPAIQIGITVDEIYQQIVDLRKLTRESFLDKGKQSRDFVLTNNSPVKVAEKIINYWTSNGAPTLTSKK